MAKFESLGSEALDHLKKNWALVTAGTIDHFNSCTISWGSFGVIWGKGNVVTVYIHPSRYTIEFLKDQPYFTVSLFPKSCQGALNILGSLSGRDGDKVAASGLTPIEFKDSVTYKEATTTLLCRKIYQHPFDPKDLAPDILDHYRGKPSVFPVDEGGEVQVHWEFIGEVVDVLENKD